MEKRFASTVDNESDPHRQTFSKSDARKRRIARVLAACFSFLFIHPNALAEEKILVSLSSDTTIWNDDVLYTFNTDGSGKARLFDFSDNAFDEAGMVLHPRISASGEFIYFSSTNASFWTPAGRNIFSARSDGTGRDQITPDPNSGVWNYPCHPANPCGVVEGTVTKSNGDPWGAAPVFLEGAPMKNADANGSFRFENVPPGNRYIMAYRTGDSSAFDSLVVAVAGNATTRAHLTADSSLKANFENPIPYGDRIYYTLSNNEIAYTDAAGSPGVTVFTPSPDLCNGIPDVDGYDVGPVTGKLAIVDYETGCTGHVGLYTADKDGAGLQPLTDFKTTPWDGAHDVFWSPDESRLALTASYNFNSITASS